MVSPLIALIRDQSSKLLEKGIECAFFDSLQSPDERRKEIAKVQSEDGVPLIYVSPERLSSPKFLEEILQLGTQNEVEVPTIVIDEVHVIAQWGRDFRPKYDARLTEAIQTLGNPQIVACSGTLPEPMRQEVIRVLGLKGQTEVVAELDRPNLKYRVQFFSSLDEKLLALRSVLGYEFRTGSKIEKVKAHKNTIVYCATRKRTEEVAEYLRDLGLPAAYYHAGMERSERLIVQERFMADALPIVIATNAFGMGIDKSDIRRIIHFETPGTLEQYAQEAGRGGRDGKPTTCDLWYQPEDVHQQIRFINSSNPSREFIKKTYDLIWGWVDQGDKTTDTPSVFIDFEKFYDPSDYPATALKQPAAIAVLENCGAIRVEGPWVRFQAKPREVNALLPTEKDIEEKRDRDKQALKVMVYYANRGASSGTTLRTTLMRHLRHNSLVESVRLS